MYHALMKTIIYLSVLAIIAFLYVRDVKLLFVTSNSMAPTMVAGDVIITCKSPYSDGSIITFRQRDVLVTHRLVSKGRMRTKGDSNLYEDPLKLYKEQIVGKALYYYRYSTWKGKTIHLEDLIVKEKMRGSGLGFALYSTIIEQGKIDNVRRIEWNVLDWNTPAIDFYIKSGAKVLDDWRVAQMDENGINEFLKNK